MAFVFQRRLAIPLWAIALFAVAFTAPPTVTLFVMPPTTVLAIAAVAIAAIVFLMPGSIPWFRTSRALVRVLPSGHRGQESGTNSTRPFVIAIALVLGWQVVSAQDMSRYRAYALESSLDSVVAASGARAADAKTLHERPATIQQLVWRAPYVDSRNTLADPVRAISFTFYDDTLYQVIVNYDRDRTEGLTNSDIVESLSAAYGAPTLASAKTRTSLPVEALPDSIVVARWENAESLLMLLRGAYRPEFQLILESKRLSTRVRSAVREALRLDAIDAPRREAELRKKEAGDASAARDKTRIANKAAFRP